MSALGTFLTVASAILAAFAVLALGGSEAAAQLVFFSVSTGIAAVIVGAHL